MQGLSIENPKHGPSSRLIRTFFVLSSLSFCLIHPSLSFAEHAVVGKVILLKGEAKIKDPDTQKILDLKMSDSVKEGANIQAGPRSFVKLAFQDGTQINIAPQGQLVVNKFPKDQPAVLSVLKGQIRAKVVKNLLQDEAQGKSGATGENKLFIKTKMAAMGVRGTEFDVIVNPQTAQTSVVTYNGEVALVQSTSASASYASMTEALNSPQAVSVREGQFAGSNEAGRVNIPVTINPAQFNELKKNDGTGSSGSSTTPAAAPVAQSPYPPGVSTKEFAAATEVKSQLTALFGADMAKESVKVEAEANSAPPEGMVKGDGSFAPPSGGLVDLKTGTYIAPPPGSTFDPNTKTFVPPSNLGTFDSKTGAYVPPTGLALANNGKLVPENSANGRAVANVNAPVINTMMAAAQTSQTMNHSTVLPAAGSQSEIRPEPRLPPDLQNTTTDALSKKYGERMYERQFMDLTPQANTIKTTTLNITITEP